MTRATGQLNAPGKEKPGILRDTGFLGLPLLDGVRDLHAHLYFELVGLDPRR